MKMTEKIVIKLKFVNTDGVVSDRQYTYYSPVSVNVGDVVRIDENPKRMGLVTEINVPLEEIEKFGDRAKEIMGLWVDDDDADADKKEEETFEIQVKIDETLIAIEQLPVLTDKLRSVKSQVDAQVAEALALPVNEENKQYIKRVRAELKRQFDVAENIRKAVKAKLLEPYEEVAIEFKECITDSLLSAHVELGKKIEEIEVSQNDSKFQNLLDYFEEKRESLAIEFVTFEHAVPKVLLSTTEPAYIRQINEFFDKITSSLTAIDAMHDEDVREETLLEFKKCLDLPKAMTIVQTRKKELEAQREAERIRAEKNAEINDKTDEVNKIIQPQKITAPQPQSAPDTGELLMTVTLELTLKRNQKDMVKQFFLDNGITAVQK